ncbi:phospholipase, patatin family protein [Trichophaea hybrida]|nr:phospholipase, patatin family protein [Trichophaea hybrida]
MVEEQPLRLLSLDGGGVKGLTSLLILHRIMRAYRDEMNLPDIPRPCEVFDLIGGASTGGLIAIMLGRLGMTVSECIQTYKALSTTVFEEHPRGGSFGRAMLTMSGSTWYSARKLENGVREVVEGAEVMPTALLRGPHTPGCRMFVCTTRAASSDTEILRNYVTTAIDQHDYDCTIIEAGMATAAAPLFFPPVKLQKSGAIFVDGAMRLNNPIEEVINEGDRIWRGRTIGCVISIGTGWAAQTRIDSKPSKLIKACVEIALSAQNKADEFIKSRTGRELCESAKYFRFNVEQGMQNMKLDECRNMERMDACTMSYLKRSEVSVQIKRCARRLAGVVGS